MAKALTDGPVRNRLFELWLPMIGGVLAVKSIGVSDAYFIGQLGEKQLAAVSFTFPVVMTLISLGIGLSSGASSVLSQAVGGAADDETRKSIVSGALSLSALIAVLLAALGAAAIDPIFAAMGAEDEIRAEAVAYMLIWFGGAVFLFTPIVVNGLLRAGGDGTTPALLMAGVAILNIALNPLFIFGWGPIPKLDVQGAAVATILARALSLVACIAILRRKNLVALDAAAWARGLKHWREIARIGAPAALSTSLNPVSVSIATAAVATLGQADVAAFGLATKIQSLALVPILALSAASAPMAGQNSGAREEARTRAMLRWCYVIALGWSLAGAVAFWLGGDWLAARFIESEEARRLAAVYLAIVPVTFAGYGVVIASSAALNGLGRSVTALALAGGRAILLVSPAAWIGVALAGFSGVAWGIGAANVVSGLAAAAFIWRHDLTVRGKSGGSASEEGD